MFTSGDLPVRHRGELLFAYGENAVSALTRADVPVRVLLAPSGRGVVC